MLQSVARGREVKVDMSPQPVQLVASDEELERAASLDRLIQGHELDPQLLEMLSGSDEEQALWLELLERRYEDDPTSGHRRQLAEARAHAGDHPGVAALLSPGWPDRLSPRERALLLDADRSNGTLQRANAIADEDVPADLLDVPVLIRATTILLDHGRVESARQVLTRAQALAPDETALNVLAARLP